MARPSLHLELAGWGKNALSVDMTRNRHHNGMEMKLDILQGNHFHRQIRQLRHGVVGSNIPSQNPRLLANARLGVSLVKWVRPG